MNDPLKRRMFRQPINPNQAMGILASSPELMGAVQQRFANGGEVIKAERGKFFYDPQNPSFIDRLLMGQGILKAREGVESQEQAKKQAGISEIIPGVNQTAVNPNPFEINRIQTVFTPEKTNIGVDGEVTTSGNIEKQLKEAE